LAWGPSFDVPFAHVWLLDRDGRCLSQLGLSHAIAPPHRSWPPPTVYHLYKKITSIGSGPDNDVVLPDPLIGDAYATIHFDGQTYTITTLARKAEVVVNGKKRGKHKLSTTTSW
jgi:hypothetical protein